MANAITSRFPDGSVANPTPFAAVAIEGGGVSTLQAETAQFEITDSVANSNVRVIIEDICNFTGGDASRPETRHARAWIGDNPGAARNNYQGNCDGNDIVFNVTTGPLINYYNNKYSNRTVTVQKVDGAGIKHFRVRVEGGVSSRVSFAPDADNQSSSFGTQDAFVIWGGGRVTLEFTPSCEYNGGGVYLKWQDADYGESNQPGGISFDLYQVTDANGQTIPRKYVYSRSGPSIGGNGTKAVSPGLNLVKGATYQWIWDNVAATNGVQLKLPFSQRTDGQTCDDGAWTLNGASNVDRSTMRRSDTANFGHYVVNSGPGTATYEYVVQKQYNPAGSGNGSWQDTALRGNCREARNGRCPNLSGIKYDFPSGADYGDQYCQRIRFTNASGGGTPSGTSGEVCVSLVRRGGDTPPPTTACNTVTASDDGTYDPPGGLDRDYDSLTYVTVTGDGGRNLIGRTYTIGASKGNSVHGVSTDYTKDHTFNYSNEPSATVTITIRRDYYNDSKGNNKWVNVSNETKTYTCFRASCKIVSVTGSRPDGIIVSGESVLVKAEISNPRQPFVYPDLLNIPESIPGNKHLSLFGTGGYHRVGTGVGLDQTEDVVFTTTAPASGKQDIILTPHFDNTGAIIGDACSTSITAYKGFHIIPSAKIISSDPEDPTIPGGARGIQYEASSQKDGPDPSLVKGVKVSASLERERAGAVSNVDAPPAKTYDYDSETVKTDPYSKAIPDMVVGDKFCAYTTVNPARGFVDENGDVLAQGQQSETIVSPQCLEFINRPYVHFMSGDVMAGGGFEDGGANACTNGGTGARIKTYFNNKSTDKGTGSGVQIGGLALDPIYGFNTALVRTSAPQARVGLTFANTGVTVNPVDSGSNAYVGGSFKNGKSWDRHCVPDYANSPTFKPVLSKTSEGTGDVSIAGGGTHHYSGAITINSLTIPVPDKANPDTKSTVIIAEGNITIANNITYPTTNYGSIDAIPSLFIISYGGNITINGNVKQLDGVYIAQPKSGVGGFMYTCDEGTTSLLLANCGNQLVVNGSFVAEKVKLLRGFGSLRNAKNDKPFNPDTGTQSCSVLAGDVPHNKQDCAGEIFNFTPETFIANPDNLAPTVGPSRGIYEYVTTLPPVL